MRAYQYVVAQPEDGQQRVWCLLGVLEPQHLPTSCSIELHRRTGVSGWAGAVTNGTMTVEAAGESCQTPHPLGSYCSLLACDKIPDASAHRAACRHPWPHDVATARCPAYAIAGCTVRAIARAVHLERSAPCMRSTHVRARRCPEQPESGAKRRRAGLAAPPSSSARFAYVGRVGGKEVCMQAGSLLHASLLQLHGVYCP